MPNPEYMYILVQCTYDTEPMFSVQNMDILKEKKGLICLFVYWNSDDRVWTFRGFFYPKLAGFGLRTWTLHSTALIFIYSTVILVPIQYKTAKKLWQLGPWLRGEKNIVHILLMYTVENIHTDTMLCTLLEINLSHLHICTLWVIKYISLRLTEKKNYLNEVYIQTRLGHTVRKIYLKT